MAHLHCQQGRLESLRRCTSGMPVDEFSRKVYLRKKDLPWTWAVPFPGLKSCIEWQGDTELSTNVHLCILAGCDQWPHFAATTLHGHDGLYAQAVDWNKLVPAVDFVIFLSQQQDQCLIQTSTDLGPIIFFFLLSRWEKSLTLVTHSDLVWG